MHRFRRSVPLAPARRPAFIALVATRTKDQCPAMRRLLAILAACAIVCAAQAADAEFLRVWPRWRDADAFERIGEYFGRTDQLGREIVRRSQPGTAEGFYFLVRLKHAGSLADDRLVVRIVRPDTPEALAFTLPCAVAAPAGETVFELGLTGRDWPGGRKMHPVAWRIDLVDAGGRVLASEKSFLWEK